MLFIQASIIRGLSTVTFAESGKTLREVQGGNGRLQRNICPSYFHNMQTTRFDKMQTDGANAHAKHNSRAISGWKDWEVPVGADALPISRSSATRGWVWQLFFFFFNIVFIYF